MLGKTSSAHGRADGRGFRVTPLSDIPMLWAVFVCGIGVGVSAGLMIARLGGWSA